MHAGEPTPEPDAGFFNRRPRRAGPALGTSGTIRHASRLDASAHPAAAKRGRHLRNNITLISRIDKK